MQDQLPRPKSMVFNKQQIIKSGNSRKNKEDIRKERGLRNYDGREQNVE